jgi:adenylyltransferase/sulfurtransferase
MNTSHWDTETLTEEEIKYYEKHLNLQDFDLIKQIKLKKAKVLVIGAGGLGCPALLHLATSGIGCIGIVDFDSVSISNLHRQTLYTFEDIGKSKAEQATKKIKMINPFIKVKPYNIKVDENNIDELIKNYDIILDAPDNYETRYIIEDICTKRKKIIIHASVFRYQGQITVFTPDTACYRCAFPNIPVGMGSLVNSSRGIFGPLTCIIGTMQAIETIKIIINMGETMQNILLCYNTLDQSIKRYKIRKNINCSICARKDEFL